MNRNLFAISILLLFMSVFYACRNSQKEAQNEAKEKPIKTINSSDAFLGKRYVYSLGCAWDSQTDVSGFLHFYSEDKFRLKIHSTIKKEKDLKKFEFLNVYYKEEIFEGKYELIPDSKSLVLKLLTSQIKIQEPNQNEKEEKREFINRSFIAKMDSCEDKSTLIFAEETEGIPNEKYYQWVEQNYSGKYISYAEGVKEEITITDEKSKFRMYYQSPSYQKPIELLIKKYAVQTTEVEASFPNNKEKVYQFSLSNNSLSTSTNDNRWQQFFKISKLKSDNPKDLALKGRNYSKVGFEHNAGKEVYDTIVPFLNNRKAKISKITKSHFIKAYQSSNFEKNKKTM